MKYFLKLFVCAALVLLIYSPVLSQTIEKTFDAPSGTELLLRTHDGDIDISTWNRREIDIKITIRGSQRFRDQYDFDVEKKGNTVRVLTRKHTIRHFGIYIGRGDYIRYNIKVPGDVPVEIDEDDGDIKIRDLNANIKINNDDGDVLINNVTTENVMIETQDGDLEINDTRADLRIYIDDGDIRMDRVSSGNIVINGQDGEIILTDVKGRLDVEIDDGDLYGRYIDSKDIHVEGQDGQIEIDFKRSYEDGRYTFNADDGDIEILLDNNYSGEIDCDADGGRIKVDVRRCNVRQQRKHSFFGYVGNGKASLKIQTVDGDIWIK